MRFLVDECAGPALARWLAKQGHTVFSVYQEARGMIYRDEHPHHGVILLRLEDERAFVKISVMQRLLDRYHDRLLDRYIVVTENRVRFSER